MPPPAPAPILRKRTIEEVERATGVRQQVQTRSGVKPMNEEEFLRTTRRARLGVRIIIVVMIIHFALFPFTTMEEAKELARWARLITAVLALFFAVHIAKTRTMRYQSFKKQYELEQFKRRKTECPDNTEGGAK